MNNAIAVMSCGANKSKRDAIRRTWASTVCVPVLFFVGDVETDDAIRLSCPDDYEHCSYKQFEMIKYMADYDSVFFCDDDTYCTSRLYNLPLHDYMGCPCMIEEDIIMAHGGAGFFLSKSAMQQACREENRELCKKTIYSDRLVGHLMKKVGISLYPDFRFNTGKYNNNVGYCNLTPNLKNKYITTHFVSEELMDLLHHHFEEDGPAPRNIYEMNFNSIPVVFFEHEGQWYCTIKTSTEMSGPFELAQHAEEFALRNLGFLTTL